MPEITGKSDEQGVPGVYGENTAGGDAVVGQGGSNGRGVLGVSTQRAGVEGNSTSGAGVWGRTEEADGVVGQGGSNGRGVVGVSTGRAGVEGNSTSGVGIWGSSQTNEGVHAQTQSPTEQAVSASNLNPNGTGAAIFGKKEGDAGHAGFFDGHVYVTKTLTVKGDIVLENSDCAEDFDITGLEKVEPGTVMVIDQEGALRQSEQAYDKRVAGVISGAGNYKPGLILDKQESSRNRMPIALLGKVFCKVDAQYGVTQILHLAV